MKDERDERAGLRATPCVVLERGGQCIGLAVRQFWQNFPKAIEATDDSLVLRLFPHQYADVHELQGGEQKTHEFAVAFASDNVTTEPLAWYRLRSTAPRPNGTRPARNSYLTPSTDDPSTAYLTLVDAPSRDDTSSANEVIDEFGWRHFGEIYGDHEAVFHRNRRCSSHITTTGPGRPRVSVSRMACRWWELMNDLAGHVADIDLYHTNEDKSAIIMAFLAHGSLHRRRYGDASFVPPASMRRRSADEHNYDRFDAEPFHWFVALFFSGHRSAGSSMDDAGAPVYAGSPTYGDTGLAAPPRRLPPGARKAIAQCLLTPILTGNPAFRAKLEQFCTAVFIQPTTPPAAICSTPSTAGRTRYFW